YVAPSTGISPRNQPLSLAVRAKLLFNAEFPSLPAHSMISRLLSFDYLDVDLATENIG
ncbi:MAG: hypothetical protein H6Q52_2791, partial [Deltaproteobacteria bacterium]|nr:hypothetical protein [Deltaproteobacteria bacterium]